jgi:DDE superfamily endonuclease
VLALLTVYCCKLSSSSRRGRPCHCLFSGHYQAYGINVQAACNHQCCCIEVCVVAPGGTNDVSACRKSTLPVLVNNLPIGYYVIGDNAYVCSKHMLTPFSGKNQKTQQKTRITILFPNCALK